MIDATKKLTIRHFNKFEEKLNNSNISLSLGSEVLCDTLTKQDVVDIFKLNTLESINDEDTLTFSNDSEALKISGKDYKKWSTPWWSSRIFAAKNKTVADELSIECFIAKRKLNTSEVYDEIHFKSTNKKDVIKFINEKANKLILQARLENAEVVYCLRYVGDDNKIFRNFDELLLDGKFII